MEKIVSGDEVIVVEGKNKGQRGRVRTNLLPRTTNVRRVNVDDSTNPPTFWVGNNLGNTIVKLEPLE